MSPDSASAGSGVPGQAPGDAPARTPTRVRRARAAAAARGIPIATIITSVAVLAVAYLAGKLLHRLRDAIWAFARPWFRGISEIVVPIELRSRQRA